MVPGPHGGMVSNDYRTFDDGASRSTGHETVRVGQASVAPDGFETKPDANLIRAFLEIEPHELLLDRCCVHTDGRKHQKSSQPKRASHLASSPCSLIPCESFMTVVALLATERRTSGESQFSFAPGFDGSSASMRRLLSRTPRSSRTG